MNVGDYVRTKDGIIAKIIDNIENPYKEKTIFVLDKEININDLEGADIYSILNPFAEETINRIDTHFQDEKIIIKSSPNIIDLIEVGDYVNGMLVIEETPKDKRKKQQIIVDSTAVEWGTERLFNKDIKSIITREMFESMEYKVGE